MGKAMNDKDSRGYEHPLALPTERGPMGPRTRVGFLGLGKTDLTWQLPLRHGEHAWIGYLGFRIDPGPLSKGAMNLDPTKLVGNMVSCWVCDRDLENLEMVTGPCLGAPDDRYIPTRDEFRSWPEERQEEWINALNQDRE